MWRNTIVLENHRYGETVYNMLTDFEYSNNTLSFFLLPRTVDTQNLYIYAVILC